jgi:cytochrome c peroxidase
VEVHKGIAAALLAIVAAGAAMKVTHRSAAPIPASAASARPVPAASAGARHDLGRQEGPLDARVALGRSIFFDASLSEPPGTSCASCHDPARGYAGDHGSGTGVAAGSRAGHFARRSTPSVLYLRFFRRFHFEWPEDSEHPEAYAGFFWDGRSSAIADLVRQPLLNRDEMGNEDAHQIAGKLARSPYADRLRAEFDGAFDTPERTLEVLGASVEAFLTSPAMAPFSSRFDAFVRGQGALSALETRGLGLFEDAAKGNCAACHTMDARSGVPERSLFTDFGYEAVGVPRNRRLALPAGSFDLGLCERHDRSPYTDQPHFCGSFRTPSLRNVALRPSFMHNGALTTLRDVVAFYATRGTQPKRWYQDGPYDDLPAPYKANVNVSSPPYDHREGDAPSLDDDEIDAVVAFLETLTDEAVPR